MRILNFGSLNIDYVYQVPHMVCPGETLHTGGLQLFCGGKGLNQSIALARAGQQVWHAGCIGGDGEMLRTALEEAGVHCELLRQVAEKTGHAIIQVDGAGENCILLYGGANRCMTSSYIDEVLSGFGPGDLLVLQNEIDLLGEIIDKAYARGMEIALNPSPFDAQLETCDLQKVSLLLVNETEGWQMTGERSPEGILAGMAAQYPRTKVVLTLGAAGAVYRDGAARYRQPACPVQAVDTTGAGDTFTGYFLAGMAEGLPPQACLRLATQAAGIAITRDGASPSIPMRAEVEDAAVPAGAEASKERSNGAE